MDLEPEEDAGEAASRFSYDVRQLVEAGLQVKVNHVWHYADMQALLGRDLTGNDAALQTAIRRLSRDHACEFKNIRRVGYVRLDDEGIVSEAPGDRLKIGRKIKRASQRSTNIRDWENLTDSLKREVDAHRSILGLMRSILRPASVRRVREEVNRARAELDVEQTVKLFRKSTD